MSNKLIARLRAMPREDLVRALNEYYPSVYYHRAGRERPKKLYQVDEIPLIFLDDPTDVLEQL